MSDRSVNTEWIRTLQLPLGALIKKIQRDNTVLFPEGLLDPLALFNKLIWCPAKHEMVNQVDECKFSVADAIAVTFITVRLFEELQKIRYN